MSPIVNTMQTIVTNELTSENDTTRYPFPDCTIPFDSNTCPTVSIQDLQRRHEVIMKFVNHVMLIWLNRARAGKKTFFMPDCALKQKAKEIAKIMRTSISVGRIWLRDFNAELKKEEAQTSPNLTPPNTSLNVEDIIKEEWPQFCYNLEKPSKDIVLDVQVPSSEEEIIEDPIQTYDEALQCLRLVEDYALCVRNYRAVGLIGQMEELIRNAECLK